MEVRDGDTVLYGKYAGSELEIDNTKYLLMREEEIQGIIRPRPAPPLPGVAAVN
jgi:chaperonin GroES